MQCVKACRSVHAWCRHVAVSCAGVERCGLRCLPPGKVCKGRGRQHEPPGGSLHMGTQPAAAWEAKQSLSKEDVFWRMSALSVPPVPLHPGTILQVPLLLTHV